MHKVNNEKLAKQIAEEENAFYGMSVFDGQWYTGNKESLEKIGCIYIKKGLI